MKLLYAGYHECGPGWAMRPHSHAHHEMIVVVHGGLCVELCGITIRAMAGDVLLYPARESHREFIDSFDKLVAYFIGFSGDWNSDQLQLKDSRGRLGQLFEWFYSERDSHHIEIGAWNNAMLRLVVAEHERLSGVGENNLVEEARGYIRRNMNRPFSLSDLAQNASLSKYHFLREYERICGLTPMADVRRIRLQQARNHILSTNEPLKVIATRVGFANENHLSRLLKETFGIGARQMRGYKQP
ncbi:MAG: hypothetical protein DRP64_07195 [Verrucomicrobia bacterium]|nr:MAG: hypothetical protein DRP64_07195 [Verrucomicrobiota bacterium]